MNDSPRISAHFQTFASLLWPWWLLWTGIAFLTLPFDLGAEQIRHWIPNPGLSAALVAIWQVFDAIWIALAAACVYFCTVEAEGLSVARHWAGRILIGAAVLGWVGATTGTPFGPFVFTDLMGTRIGRVLPWTFPLLWLVLILGSRSAVFALSPRVTRWPRWGWALGAAMLVLLSDLNLERMIRQTRPYWIWYPGQTAAPHWPPVQNCLAWFLAAFLLLMMLPATSSKPATHPHRPWIILALMNAVFLASHCFR